MGTYVNTMLILAGTTTRDHLDELEGHFGRSLTAPDWHIRGGEISPSDHDLLANSGLSYVYLFDGTDEGLPGFDAYDDSTGERFTGTTDTDHMSLMVSCNATPEDIADAQRWLEFLQRMMNERTRELTIIEDAPDQMNRDESGPNSVPAEPGHFWGRLNVYSQDSPWEVLQVIENDMPDKPDHLRALMFGIEWSYSLDVFEWGPRVPDYHPEGGTPT